MKSKKHFGIDIWKDFIRNGRRIFFYELLFYCFIYFFIRPVFDLGVAYAMNLAGYSYLTVENIFQFIGKPATILIMLGLTMLAGIIQIFAVTLIMTYCLHIRQGWRVNLWNLFAGTMKRCWIFILPKNYLLPLQAILISLFSNIVLMIGIATRVSLPRYYIQNIAKISFIKPVFIILATILLIAAFLSIFLMPYCMLEHKSVRESGRNGRQLLRKRRIRSALYFVICNLLLALVSVFVYRIVIVFAAVLVKMFVARNMVTPVFLSFYNHINTYVGIFIGILSLTANIYLMTRMYFYYKEEEDEEYAAMKHPPVFGIQKKVPKHILLLLLAVVFIVDIFYTYDLVKNGASAMEENLSYIKVTSHRGASYNAPENTIPAMEEAIKSMSDYVEIDVQQTSDGEVVLMHDSNILRVAGVQGQIKNMTYDEVMKLDVGQWFSDEFKGTKIPTLEEVMILCKGKINLNIEIKGAKSRAELIKKVMDLVKKYNFERQCVITSSRYSDLAEVKKIDKNVKTGHILAAAYGAFYKREEADFFSLKSGFITEGLVQRIHKEGKEVHAWTVNQTKEMERLRQIGVDNLITDRPVTVRRVIYQPQKNKTLLELLDMIK